MEMDDNDNFVDVSYQRVIVVETCGQDVERRAVEGKTNFLFRLLYTSAVC